MVVGMARSGVAAVQLLLEKGARVAAVDQSPDAVRDRVPSGVPVLPQSEESFADAQLADAQLIVLSPGVPADLGVLAPAGARGVKVIGDLELASWFLQGETIGITGSNGKTTTTALVGHILKESSIACQVGGNIGTPPASLVVTSKIGQWNVLELSSFQLETTETFRAHIGSVLNVTPDHLDRHYTMENYAAAKGRLFANQTANDFAVLNADDAICSAYAKAIRSKALWFSSSRSTDGAFLRDGEIILHGQPLMASSEVPLRGLHNLENTMAAALMASLAGGTHAQIRAAVMTFPGVEHRIEFVRNLDGVAYYNDSKATNVDATLKAIAAFDGGLWIILGGKDKNSDYTALAEPLKAKARGVLLIGAATPKIEAQLESQVKHQLAMIPCGTMDRAVAYAHAHASTGDTVLLAPACASFDQFQNFEHRGREFKRLVMELAPATAGTAR